MYEIVVEVRYLIILRNRLEESFGSWQRVLPLDLLHIRHSVPSIKCQECSQTGISDLNDAFGLHGVTH